MSPTGLLLRRQLLCSLLVVGACAPPNASDTEGEAEEGSGEESEPFTPIPVEVALVAPADLHRVVSGSTTLSSALQVAAVAELAGSVREVSVEGGDSVTVGQVLARVVNDDVRISIDEARQAVERNEREVERLRPLFDRGFLAAQTFETAEYQLETAQTGLHRLRTQGATQTVRAPIDGVITRREVETGAVVVPNQVLFEIMVIDSLEARIAVPERELGQLRVGQAAVLTAEAFPDQTFVGSVTRIDPIVNPRTGTVAVRVSLEQITGAEGALLRPGMFSGVRIVTDTRDAVASVPKRALVREAGVHYVFEIGDVVERPPFEGSGEPTGLQLLTPFEVRRVEVTLGYENRDRVQVDELDVGSRVIVVGQAGLDADSVVVIPFDRDPAND